MWIGDFILTRVRRTYIKDFKLRMAKLYENGMTRIEIIREYDLTLVNLLELNECWVIQSLRQLNK